jgi:NAD(P)-dependent dehydrogenase (short-subunit alcohol dehydrogenase family)
MHTDETRAGVDAIDFTGQVAIVTGAGRGLGRLYALDLARRGASVVVNDVGSSTDGQGSDAGVADGVVDEIRSAGGIATASHESVDSPEGGHAIVRTAVDEFGRIDAVVSNAGIFQTLDFEHLSPGDWRRMLSVHLDGGFYLSQPAFRVMQAQRSGRFVFIASSAGFFGQPQVAHYAAAKAGLLGLTNVIAIEGADHGILANAVLPFGYSRMVTDAIADREQIPEELAFLDAIKTSSSCRWSCSSPAAPAPSVTTTTRPVPAASPASSSASATGGSPMHRATRPRRTSPPTSPRPAPLSHSRPRCRSSTRSPGSAPGWASSDPGTQPR